MSSESIPLNTSTIAPFEDGYRVRWPALDIEMFVTEPQRKGSSVRASLLPKHGDTLLLAAKNISLMSHGDLASYAKRLDKAYPLDEDRWATMIESLAHSVLKRLDGTEPAMAMDDVIIPASETVEPFALNPLIYAHHVTICYGPPGTYKTLLSLLCALRLGSVGETAGLASSDAYRVLMVQYEMDALPLRRMTDALIRGHHGLSSSHLHLWKPSKALRSCVGDLMRQLRDSGARALVIDSLGPAAGGKLTDADDATDFFLALGKAAPGFPVMTLAHSAKNAEDSNRTIYGSMFFNALSRRVYEHIRVQPDILLLQCRKQGFGAASPLAWRVFWKETDAGLSVTFSPADPELCYGTIEDRIVRVLERAEEPQSLSEIRAHVPEATRQHLKRALEDQRITCVEQGAGGKESLWIARQ